MKKRIILKDKTFQESYSSSVIESAVKRISKDIKRDVAGTNPLFLVVLNGAFMFASDLLKEIDIPDAEISFIKLSSYSGSSTTGVVRSVIGLTESIENRSVVIIEDIVDTGITMNYLISEIEGRGAKEVKVVSLVSKPDALQESVTIDYLGFEIANEFIVGYGLDYDGLGRNFKDIYTVIE